MNPPTIYSPLPRDAHRQAWLNRRRKKILKHVLKKKVRIREWRRCRNRLPIDSYNQTNVATSRDSVSIALPEKLDLEENYEATCSHFASIRKAASGRQYKFKNLRFHQMNYISPSAALILASEMDVWNRVIGRKLRADVGSWNSDIKRLLSEMGYFELLKLPPPSATSPKNTKFIRFRRAKVGADQSGELAKSLRKEIEDVAKTNVAQALLFHGISEAITNVTHHAYLPGDKSPYWWLSASYDQETSMLVVMFYDQGRGIPVTLKSSKPFEHIKELIGAMTDSQRIEAAMTEGRTSTSQRERGKGLQNLQEFAQAHQQGRLRIYSNRGMVEMTFSDGKTGKKTSPSRKDFCKSIGGTLIEWSVCLSHEKNKDLH